MDKTIAALNEFGLTGNKAKVYLALLEVGHGSIIDIAKKAHLPRTTTHEIVQQLLELGLLSYTSRGKRSEYIAEKPKKLAEIMDERRKKIAKIIPQLDLLCSSRGLRPKVRFYEGVPGVRTVLEDTLTSSDKVLHGVLSMEDLYKIPGKMFMDDYIKRRCASGLELKVIRSQVKEVEENWPSSKEEARELRYAPSYLVFPMTVYIYDNKVSVVSTSKESYGMIIESVDFFQTIKNFFDVLWDLSRKA